MAPSRFNNQVFPQPPPKTYPSKSISMITLATPQTSRLLAHSSLPAVVFALKTVELATDLPFPGRTGTQTNDPSLFRNLWTSEVDECEGRMNVDCERSRGRREGSDGKSAVRSERSDIVRFVVDVVVGCCDDCHRSQMIPLRLR